MEIDENPKDIDAINDEITEVKRIVFDIFLFIYLIIFYE